MNADKKIARTEPEKKEPAKSRQRKMLQCYFNTKRKESQCQILGEYVITYHKNGKRTVQTKAQYTRRRAIKMILKILALLVMLVLITGAAGKMGDPSNPMDTYAIVGSCIMATVILIMFVIAGGTNDEK